jgi:hypothetical protein
MTAATITHADPRSFFVTIALPDQKDSLAEPVKANVMPEAVGSKANGIAVLQRRASSLDFVHFGTI